MNVSVIKRKVISFTRDYTAAIAVLILCLLFAVLKPEFVRPTNLMNILLQASTIAIVAIGQAIMLINGQLDLSLGQNVCLSCFVSAYLMKYVEINPILSLGVGLLCATTVGFMNGLIFTKLHIPAFIATLAMQNICKGCAKLITQTKTIGSLPDDIDFLGRGYIAEKFPVSVVVMLILIIIMAIVLGRTKLGRNFYAIGGNEEAAFFSGINTTRHYLYAFILSGFFAGVSACVLLSRLDSAGVGNGNGYEFEAMIGCVIGGVSMNGGKGKLVGMLFGVLFSVILFNGMTLLNVHSFIQDVFKGIVLVLAMALDVLRNRRKTR